VPHIGLHHTSWLSHCLSPSSHCAALSLSCRASWLSHCLSPSSHCTTLSSTHCSSPLLSHRLSSSSCCAPRRRLILSSRRLVVALPLDAPPSRRLVVSLCRLSLSCRASWLSRHHLSSSSRCTVLSSSHRAGWFVLPLLAPPSCSLVLVHCPRHRTPSNAAAAIEHHRHRCH
jgi:hypothetical protein